MKMPTPPYEVIAREYYDQAKHPTCAAFRAASLSLFQRCLQPGVIAERDVVEVGCGRSIFCDVEVEHWKSLTVIDESASMLEHSRKCLSPDVQFVVGNARQVFVPDSSVDVLISSLGDPYNDDLFWFEAYRVLRKGGLLFFSTPSIEWAASYRPVANDPLHSALFQLSNGELVATPSFIQSRDQQRSLITSASLQVLAIEELRLSQLDAVAARCAPKLALLGEEDPVVTLFICQKP